jgi:hypothetical protein
LCGSGRHGGATSAIGGRATRHAGHASSRRRREPVEEPLGWLKTVGGLAKLRHRGKGKASAIFALSCAACNQVRLRTPPAEPASA